MGDILATPFRGDNGVSAAATGSGPSNVSARVGSSRAGSRRPAGAAAVRGIAAVRRHCDDAAGIVHDVAVTSTGEKELRPWGSYEVLADTTDHKVKRITVDPGQRLSYQRHDLRAEHWFVVRGTGTVTLDGREHPVEHGVAIDVGHGVAHRISNPGSVPLVFIEVQHGDYFGEDDIERLDDDYGRAEPTTTAP